MSLDIKQMTFASLAALALSQSALAADFSNAASYNSPYGLQADAENQTIDPSLRDANGNLTVVNGVFTSSAFSQQTGVQSMGTISGSQLATLGTSSGSGVGTSGTTGTTTAGASAIGNSLNVVTVGNNNTVIVNSTQTNNGNQTATVSLNGQ